MPPRFKIPLLISLALVSLFLILLFGARIILLRSYEDLEEKEARANVERVINALKAELESINSLAKDYAGWDDSYRFVQDGNREFIRKNLDDPNFEQLGVNLIVYLDKEGKWIYSRNFDLQKKQNAPFPKSLRTILTPECPLSERVDQAQFLRGNTHASRGKPPRFRSSDPYQRISRSGCRDTCHGAFSECCCD